MMMRMVIERNVLRCGRRRPVGLVVETGCLVRLAVRKGQIVKRFTLRGRARRKSICIKKNLDNTFIPKPVL